MTNQNTTSQNKSLRFDAIRWVLPLSCAAFGAIRPDAARADVEFIPTLQVMETYVDNIFLVPPGVPKDSEMITQIIPQININASTNRLTGAMNYLAQGLIFQEQNDENTIRHQGALAGQWTVLRDLLFIDATGRYSQQSIDPAEADNPDNILITNNLTSRLSSAVAPTLSKNFGRMTGTLRHAYGITKFTDADVQTIELQDSTANVTTMQFGTADRENRMVWDLVGKHTNVDFDVADTYKYDQAFAAGALETTRNLWLLTTVGQETDLLDSGSAGGLDGTFWLAGFRWKPSDTNMFQAQFGHRFFGDAYNVQWIRRARILELAASYSEEPTTDSESSAIEEFVPGNIKRLTPGEIDLDFFNSDVIRPTFEPYVRKAVDLEATITGRRTTVELRGYHVRREYIDSVTAAEDDEVFGTELIVSRMMSAVGNVQLLVDFEDATLRDGGDFKRTGYSLGYQRRFGTELMGSITGTYREGTGTSAYDVKLISLGLRKTW